MAYPQGIDFRATSGYVTDPATCDYEIGTTANYPRTTPVQGNVVGWEVVGASFLTRDRNTGTPKLAGLAGSFNSNAETSTYRMDLPSTGSYDIRLALGDHDNQVANQFWEIFDNVTSLGVICNNADTGAADHWIDATGVVRTSSADWVTNNAALTKTFASTIFRIKSFSGLGSGFSEIGHVFVQSSGGAAAFVAPPIGRQMQAVKTAAGF